MDTFKMFIVSLSVIDNYLKKGDVMSTSTLHRCLSVGLNNFILYMVGETGAHWDTGYSGTIDILEILRKRMPI